jgi:hypothetical protein
MGAMTVFPQLYITSLRYLKDINEVYVLEVEAASQFVAQLGYQSLGIC